MRYAAEHSDLSAVWRWMYPALVMQDAVATALSIGPDFTPYEALRRMYRRSDPSTRPPAPKSQWTLEGGSPLSQDLFRVVAGRRPGNSRTPLEQKAGGFGWMFSERKVTQLRYRQSERLANPLASTPKASRIGISSVCSSPQLTSVSYGRSPE